jgi:hypothetical protein
MKRALFIVLLVGLMGPDNSISQDNSAIQKISLAGYGLIKESNELNIIKADLIDVRKKLLNIGEIDDLGVCYISRLIENISQAEMICKYEGLILGTLDQIGENDRLTQYKVHENRLKHYTLKSLYLNYKGTQPGNANIEDKVVLELAEKAKKEMSVVAELVEDVIKILHSQSIANP